MDSFDSILRPPGQRLPGRPTGIVGKAAGGFGHFGKPIYYGEQGRRQRLFLGSSYYQGKYYYYWGPVSGLLAAGIKLFDRNWLIQDQFLVILAIAGLAVVQGALIYWLQKKYFPKIPGWVVMGLVLLSILNTPVFWLISHPIVHEVPISAGQLFLILGLYTMMRGLESQKWKVPLLTLTGFFWGAAIGSRLDLGIGIAWIVSIDPAISYI